ncbi:MAG TPA: glycosyltransferase family 2 protein [Flavobacterium sp.]|nr:glycosyltransferase family 2 protein [Flavobacterium sp.]
MLSILIPIFNYDVTKLVFTLHHQVKKLNIDFEIICIDDCSSDEKYREINKKITTLSSVNYYLSSENNGRSKIRNMLSEQASYEWLLFLDADVIPVQDHFIETYIENISLGIDLIVGGIYYERTKPTTHHILRWYYGNKREVTSAATRNKEPFQHFASANFLIRKSVFTSVLFNEAIKSYGHEDTLFSFEMKNNNKNILHIDNPVYHLGLETNELFLKKSLLSVESAFFLKKEDLITLNYIRVLDFHEKLKKIKGLDQLIYTIGKYGEPLLIKNLLGRNPSLNLLDFYKLYHLIKLERDA